ncbi:MAG: hypothetical protein D6696_19555 [Acidobacteria bacterium]|nr:MAG: hypothetical protein D6696_19555 [Acidobacteriota bacterium]
MELETRRRGQEPAAGRRRRARRAPIERLRSRLSELELSLPRAGRDLTARLRSLPPKPPAGLRLVTFNIAHGRRRRPHQTLVGRERVRRNLSQVARVLEALKPDVVALQEADGPSAWSGNFDHVATLAAESRLNAHYRGDHNPFGFGRYALASGTALLARWPLIEPRSHRFGSSWRCTKGFVVATVEVPSWDGLAIDVASVHLDFLAPQKRRQQIDAMAEVLEPRRRSRPLVVLGDLNCCYEREPESISVLTRRLGLRAYRPERPQPTYPAYLPRRRLDWILVSDELVFHHHQRLPVKLSDHLGVVADLQLRASA